jgi:hypothetical protein
MTAADGDRIGSQGQSGGDSQADQLNHEMTRQQTHDAVREFAARSWRPSPARMLPARRSKQARRCRQMAPVPGRCKSAAAS